MNNHSPITIIAAALALAVVRIVLKHPALLQRQACITDMLWHIGIGQRPYQVTATLGYDNLDERFVQLAGESRSLLPDLRQAFQAYNLWTEGEGQFWVFWKPSVGGDGDATGASVFAIPSACRNSQSMIDKKY